MNLINSPTQSVKEDTAKINKTNCKSITWKLKRFLKNGIYIAAKFNNAEIIKPNSTSLFEKNPSLKIDCEKDRRLKALNNCVNDMHKNATVLAFSIPSGKYLL